LLEQAGEWSGEIEEQIEDDWESGQSSRRTYLKTGGRLVPLVVDPAPEPRPGCGTRVRVRGARLGDDWIVGALSGIERRGALSCTTSGEQKVAVILVNFPSVSLPASVTASSMQTAFFGAGRSLDTYWREVSGGAAWATGSVFGPYTLSTGYTCDQFDAIRTAAIQAADPHADFRQYNRLFLIVPNAGSCSIGRGSLGCSSHSSSDGSFTASTTWLRADYLTANDATLSVAAHEGGHNLGLDHASSLDHGAVAVGAPGVEGTHSEYGNWYSVMGISWRIGSSYNIGHYSAFHKSRLGWLAPGSGYQTITAAAAHTVLPFETGTTGTRALRMQRGPGSDKWLWLEYRRPEGLFDTNLSSYSSNVFSGALIHYEDPASSYAAYSRVLDFHPSSTPNNFNDAALQPGESWADPYSLLRIVVDSSSQSGLVARVSYDSSCAVVNPAAQTLSAASQPGSVSVTAPTGCSWTAVSDQPWLQVTGGSSGSGNGVVSFTLSANTSGSSRTATLTIERQQVSVTQTAAVPPGSVSLQSPANSATGVALAPDLTWTAAANASSYDLHLGTSSTPPLFASGLSATSHNPGGLH
jgi:M6 family metalloprotease-like protein